MIYQPGVALSDLFNPSAAAPFQPTIDAALAAGAKRLEFPIWIRPGNPWNLAAALAYAHSKGIPVHLAFHVGETSPAPAGMPVSDGPGYVSAIQEQLNGSGLGPGDSASWWNELEADWSKLPAVYNGIGSQIGQIIKGFGAESVAPLPGDEAPQRFLDYLGMVLKGYMPPLLGLEQADSLEGHLYESDLSPALPTLASQLLVFTMVQDAFGKPVRIGEYGGRLPGKSASSWLPDPAWYAGVSSWLKANGTFGFGWQNYGPAPDGYWALAPNVAGGVVNPA